MVSDTTYQEWAKGFYAQLQRPPMRGQWKRICKGDLKEGNSANFSHVRNFDKWDVVGRGLYDPCDMWWIHRWWRGLSPGKKMFKGRRIRPRI
jgi:hypothetical protein